MTLREAINKWLVTVKQTKSSNTATSYNTAGTKFLKNIDPDMPVKKLKPKHIVVIIDATYELSPNTADLYTAAIRQFFKYADLHEWADLPVAKVNQFVAQHKAKNHKPQLNVDLDYANQILEDIANINGSVSELRDRAFLMTLATTGLRLSEALSLKVDDVDFISMKTTVTGKGGRTADIYWSPMTLEYIREYIVARDPEPDEYLFIRHDIPTKEALSPSGARKLVKKMAPEMSVHMWRHVAISNFLKATNDVKATTEFARHASSATTLDRYGHLLDGEVQDLHRKAFE